MAIVAIVIFGGCKEPFEADIQGQDKGFLVVDGYINIGPSAVTTIRLSRTTNVSVDPMQVWEEGAIVAIEDEELNRYPLTEYGKGTYSSDALALPTTQKFRIAILTTDAKQYYSEFEQPVVTPSIDSVVWRRTDEGVGIYISTHGKQDRTDYYKWDYEEVWEIRSPAISLYTYTSGQPAIRPGTEVEAMRSCWKFDYPQGLVTASTASFTEDAVSMKSLILIPTGDEKLSYKYAVTVTQTALSRENYEYLRVMEKNTNAVGTFTDPQPSELFGNLYRDSSDEPVVGFVGAYTTSQVRLRINEQQVPDWNFPMECNMVTIMNNPDSLAKYKALGYLLGIADLSSPPNTFTGAPGPCADCRLRDGTNNKPDFWE